MTKVVLLIPSFIKAINSFFFFDKHEHDNSLKFSKQLPEIVNIVPKQKITQAKKKKNWYWEAAIVTDPIVPFPRHTKPTYAEKEKLLRTAK